MRLHLLQGQSTRLDHKEECQYRKRVNRICLQDALGRQAKILIAHHQFEEAMPILKEREQLCKALEVRFGWSDTLFGLIKCPYCKAAAKGLMRQILRQ